MEKISHILCEKIKFKLPNSLINSVNTPGSLSIKHQFPALSLILIESIQKLSYENSDYTLFGQSFSWIENTEKPCTQKGWCVYFWQRPMFCWLCVESLVDDFAAVDENEQENTDEVIIKSKKDFFNKRKVPNVWLLQKKMKTFSNFMLN